ncbi:MAG: histidine kinase [Bryobacterales bacterium]|nr:histidine kinase [Bryobacteraceae bacterium]MDW8354871.1 histidine kinase [Bryobacterales bacterium]
MTHEEAAEARLLAALIDAHQQDCAQLSRVLHDEVGQILTAVGLQLELLRLDFREQLPALDARLAAIQALLETAVSRIRRISYDLDPALVEKAGLAFALEQLVGRYRQKFDGPLRLMVDLPERLPDDVAKAFYEIADRALANAVQHAQTPRIEVLVHPSAEGSVLEVRDWGVGFSRHPPGQKIRGLGVLLMEHFAARAGIRLSIESILGQGTVVRAVRPNASVSSRATRD